MEEAPGTAGTARTGAAFSSWAAEYEEVWAPVLLPYDLRLVEPLPLARASAVLEVGTGTGVLLRPLAERAPGARIVGLDRSEGMLSRCPPGFDLCVADGQRLPFPDAAFDVVAMPFMLFLLPDPSGGLREAARVLRPGGMAAVAAWGPDVPYPPFDLWVEELDRAGAPSVEALPRTDELMDSPDKLAALMAGAGFEDVRAVAEPFLLPLDVDGVIRRYTGLGLTRARYEGLDPEGRRGVLDAYRRRLETLPPADLDLHDEVVMAWAARPSGPKGSERVP